MCVFQQNIAVSLVYQCVILFFSFVDQLWPSLMIRRAVQRQSPWSRSLGDKRQKLKAFCCIS